MSRILNSFQIVPNDYLNAAMHIDPAVKSDGVQVMESPVCAVEKFDDAPVWLVPPASMF